MTSNPRTIDNLGYEASQRYALDQQALNETKFFTQDSAALSKQAKIDVKTPAFHSELDQIFQAEKKNTSWAQFSPPMSSHNKSGSFFTYELLPSLLLQENNEHYKKKILSLKEKQEKNSSEQDDPDTLSEKEEEERRKKALINLLDCILHLDKCMIYVQTKRSQYHKG